MCLYGMFCTAQEHFVSFSVQSSPPALNSRQFFTTQPAANMGKNRHTRTIPYKKERLCCEAQAFIRRGYQWANSPIAKRNERNKQGPLQSGNDDRLNPLIRSHFQWNLSAFFHMSSSYRLNDTISCDSFLLIKNFIYYNAKDYSRCTLHIEPDLFGIEKIYLVVLFMQYNESIAKQTVCTPVHIVPYSVQP